MSDAISEQLENFQEAFKTSSGGCRRKCRCGRVFYNSDGGWDWEEGELDELRENASATDLAWTVGTIMVGNVECVLDCDCWHGEAKRIIDWIDRSGANIVEYLKLEKRRLQREADEYPTMEEPASTGDHK